MEQPRVVPALIASMEAAMERLLATKVPKRIVANPRYRSLLMQECKPGGPVVYDFPQKLEAAQEARMAVERIVALVKSGDRPSLNQIRGARDLVTKASQYLADSPEWRISMKKVENTLLEIEVIVTSTPGP